MSDLIAPIPEVLERLVRTNLLPGEQILVQLKGLNKTALVCTDRRVMIPKAGWLTGHFLGSDMFQLSLRAVGSAEVRIGIVNCYLEISAPGVANTKKDLLSFDSPAQSKNAIPFERPRAKLFQRAAAFITNNAIRHWDAPPAAPAGMLPPPLPSRTTIVDHIERLMRLRNEGGLTLEEYEQAKTKLLA